MYVRFFALANLLVLTACHRGTSFVESHDCVIAIDDPISLEAMSSLGFSGSEVVSIFDGGELPVEVRGPDGSTSQRVFYFTFTPTGTATVETTPDAEPARTDCETMIAAGPGLVVPGTFTVDAADGWLSASGDASLYAKGPSPDQIWLGAATDNVDPSEELRAALLVGAPVDDAMDGCAATDLVVTLIQGTAPDESWDRGPQGGINTHICGRTGLGVYQWGTYFQ